MLTYAAAEKAAFLQSATALADAHLLVSSLGDVQQDPNALGATADVPSTLTSRPPPAPSLATAARTEPAVFSGGGGVTLLGGGVVQLESLIDTPRALMYGIIVLGIDAKGLVNEWNNKAVELTSFTRQDVVGRHLLVLTRTKPLMLVMQATN
jgi:hypothetical protein